MGRPKLKNEEKKGKLGITISKSLINKLKKIPNKSEFIETLVKQYFNEKL